MNKQATFRPPMQPGNKAPKTFT